MPSVVDEKEFIIEQLAERIPKLDLDQLRRVQDFVQRIDNAPAAPPRDGTSLLDQALPKSGKL